MFDKSIEWFRVILKRNPGTPLPPVLLPPGYAFVTYEEAEALRSRAFTITGSASQVATFTQGLTQIGGEHFSSLVSATLLGNVDAGERRQAAALGLELTPVSLQQLIIHLTSTASHRKSQEIV